MKSKFSSTLYSLASSSSPSSSSLSLISSSSQPSSSRHPFSSQLASLPIQYPSRAVLSRHNEWRRKIARSKESKRSIHGSTNHHSSDNGTDASYVACKPAETSASSASEKIEASSNGLRIDQQDENGKMTPLDNDRPLVAIVGGGIGGLACAIALQQYGMQVRIYERDDSFWQRAQGYGLTLQQGGAAAVQLGLPQEGIASRAHYYFTPQGEIKGFFGRIFSSLRTQDGGGPTRSRFNLHIPRQQLRRLLMDRVDPGTVSWSKRLLYYQPHSSSDCSNDSDPNSVKPPKVTLVFEDGTSQDADVLIGADGIFSIIRNLKMGCNDQDLETINQNRPNELDQDNDRNSSSFLSDSSNSLLAKDLDQARDKQHAQARSSSTDNPLLFLGVIVILGIAPSTHPLNDQQIFQTIDGCTRWYCMPFTNDDYCPAFISSNDQKVVYTDDTKSAQTMEHLAHQGNTTMWQLSWPCSEEEAIRLGSNPALLQAAALERLKDWHEPIPTLIRSTPLELLTGYPVYDRDLCTPEQMQRNSPQHAQVTLLGDAAHPMSPFKGQGANQALLDAVSLAKALGHSQIGPDYIPKHLRQGKTKQQKQAAKRRRRMRKQLGREKKRNEAEADYGKERPKKEEHDTRPSLSQALATFEKDMLHRANKKVMSSRQAAKRHHSPQVLDIPTLRGGLSASCPSYQHHNLYFSQDHKCKRQKIEHRTCPPLTAPKEHKQGNTEIIRPFRNPTLMKQVHDKIKSENIGAWDGKELGTKLLQVIAQVEQNALEQLRSDISTFEEEEEAVEEFEERTELKRFEKQSATAKQM